MNGAFFVSLFRAGIAHARGECAHVISHTDSIIVFFYINTTI